MERTARIGRNALFALLLLAVTITLLVPTSESLYSETGELEKWEIKETDKNPSFDFPALGMEEDQKEVPSGITDITLLGTDGGNVYPNTPFVIRISYESFSPETLTVFLDSHQAEAFISHDIQTNSFLVSDELSKKIVLDHNGSMTRYNTTVGGWETDIDLMFTWEALAGIPMTIRATMESTNGYIDNMEKPVAYELIKDIEIIGETLIEFENPDYATPDNFVKGGSFIKFHGLSVIFKDSTGISPLPGDIELGIIDTRERVWEYIPEFRSELQNLQFSFMAPKIDGKEIFTFKILSAHPTAEVSGFGEYTCIIDSTDPTLGDLRTEHENGITSFDVAIDEDGSGIDISSFRYQILDPSNNIIINWRKPDHPVIEDNWIGFDVDDLEIGNYNIKMDVDDRVSNSRNQPKVFYFSTLPLHYHDISIDPLISVSMDPVIESNLVHFRTSVFNNGNQDESDLVTEIIMNDILYLREIIPSIPAGQSREVEWEWESLGEHTTFKVVLDPMGSIEDVSTVDNTASISVDPQYRDLSARADYLIPSDWNANDGDVISLSFMINNIGSIGSDQFKVQILEEGEFLGQYIIPKMEPDSSSELKIDWIVKSRTEKIQLRIDPLNEIIETVEWNNVISIDNPFFETDNGEQQSDNKDDPVIDDDEGSQTDEKDDREDVIDNGGTIWKGPEEEKDNEIPIIPIPSTDDDDPPMSSNDPNLIPLIIPSAAITISLMILGGALLTFRFEPFRYKWALALAPLYSKLKRSNIEKGLRFEILGYLKARPGANYSELKRNLDLNDGTLVHHLRILEREEKIYSKKLGKYKLFYASSYRRQSAIDDYISPFHKRILEIISSNPGIVPKKLSLMLDRSQTDISYHLSELSRNGYLEKRKKGRNSHYYLNTELVELLSA